MGITHPDPAVSPHDLSDDQLLHPAVLSRLPYPFLRTKRNELAHKREDLRVGLVMKLAVAASRAKHPLPVLAEIMGLSERALGALITLSDRELNPAMIMSFFAVSEAGDPQETREFSVQLEAFLKAERAHEVIVRERMRRDRENRENERVSEEKIAAERERRAIERKLAMTVRTVIADAPGHDCMPNPLDARSQEEFVDTMRRYRIWAGNPSFREMARRCGQRFSHATFRNILEARTVPQRLDMVETFVVVLGGTPDDKIRWATAWRHFTVPRAAGA
ncbi:hypothetical protein [Streptosporangium sp. NPDC000509]|uniref:hypothetical protein n=1 Tax=Streptosporangium sp. NPDC000509 TaxID=3366186 RepID=UPI0036BBDEDE